MDHNDRAQTPHSLVSVSTFLSVPSAPPKTPDPGALPYDQHISPSGGGFLDKRKTDTAIYTHRTRTLSNVSCVSNLTWWSAVSERKDEKEVKPMNDSGVALEGVVQQERRGSVNSSSTTRQRKGAALVSRSTSAATMVSRPRRHTGSSQGSSRRPSTSGTQLRPPACSSCSWDSSEAITEARKQKRREIAQSLSQKYPNDRAHGTFLPFITDFSHSADSLSPVQFAPSSASDTVVTPVTPPLLGPRINKLREEYEKDDNRKRSVWNQIRTRFFCGATLFGCGAKKEFWEDGDDDKGSVRRYRLELPDPDEGAVKPLPVRVRSVPLPEIYTSPPSSPGRLEIPPADDDETLEKWSMMGIHEGRRVTEQGSEGGGVEGLPPGFREEEAASPFVPSTVRGEV